MESKDYAQLTLEELVIEERKIKKNENLSAVLIGFSVGVMVYGVVKNGVSFLNIAIPLFLIVIFYRNSKIQKQKLKQIRAEISTKSTM